MSVLSTRPPPQLEFYEHAADGSMQPIGGATLGVIDLYTSSAFVPSPTSSAIEVGALTEASSESVPMAGVPESAQGAGWARDFFLWSRK